MFSNTITTNFPQSVLVKKKIENRLIFGEDMDKSLRLTFLGHPVVGDVFPFAVARIQRPGGGLTVETMRLPFWQFLGVMPNIVNKHWPALKLRKISCISGRVIQKFFSTDTCYY